MIKTKLASWLKHWLTREHLPDGLAFLVIISFLITGIATLLQYG